VIHLDFLYTAVSWVLLRWHQLFTAVGLDKDGGLNWALSIVFLVITARVLLFRFFIKQVHYQRRMMQMQPKLNAIKQKYKDDRQAQQREMMKLQQEEGFNPLAGCLPMFLQIPVFICLFHVLRHLANSVSIADKLAAGQPVSNSELKKLTLYSFTQSETISGAKAKLFGAPLAASFRDSSDTIIRLGGTVATTRWVILPLLLISAGATLATQLMSRANAPTQPEGTAASIQRIMLWVIPLGVLASGLLFNFPLGVLLYWFTSNLWTLAQQAYIIKYHPHDPATLPAAAAPPGAVGKTLAPRPGAKPVRPGRTPAGPPAGSNDADGVIEGVVAESADVDPAGTAGAAASPSASGDAAALGRNAPRPGQRPNRPGGNRPAAKRASKAKKRR